VLKEDSRGDSTGNLAFESYVFKYPLAQINLEKEQKSLEELSISEIRERIQTITRETGDGTDQSRAFKRRADIFARILILQRFVYPFSCIALAFISFPIGLVNFGKGRLNNVSLGLVAIFGYYALTLAAERAARSYLIIPEIAVPAPALFFIVFSVYLIDRVRRERLSTVAAIFDKVLAKCRRR
jgi:lipopolysaccharide export LptBFGC system permease protein LptF